MQQRTFGSLWGSSSFLCQTANANTLCHWLRMLSSIVPVETITNTCLLHLQGVSNQHLSLPTRVLLPAVVSTMWPSAVAVWVQSCQPLDPMPCPRACRGVLL
jgi:hypothetical protein